MVDVIGGTSRVLQFDDTTITTARMHQYMSHTAVDHTCEVGDYDNWATDSLSFAGISMIRYPYQTYSELLSSPYGATNLTIALDAQEGGKNITVMTKCGVIVLAGETITCGQTVMQCDLANHDATNTHDGMVSADDGSTAAEMYAIIGIAQTGGTMVTGATHTFDMEDYDETNHPAIEVLLWR